MPPSALQRTGSYRDDYQPEADAQREWLLHQAGIMPNDWTPTKAQPTSLQRQPTATAPYSDDYAANGLEREWMLQQAGIMPNDWTPTKAQPTSLQRQPTTAPYSDNYAANGLEREWLLHQAGMMPNDWTPTLSTNQNAGNIDVRPFRPTPGVAGPTRSDLTSSGLSPVGAELHKLAAGLASRQLSWEDAFAPHDAEGAGVVSISTLLKVFRSVGLAPEASLFRSLPPSTLAPHGVRYSALVQLFS